MSFDLKIKDGDLAIGTNGDLATVENTDKLIQDIVKILVTQIGSNPFFPWYGSPITKTLIGTAMERSFVSSIATQQLRSTLDRLKTLQRDQMRSNQIVTASEQLASVSNVMVDRNPLDYRYYAVLVTVMTKAFSQTTIPLNFKTL